MGFRRPTEKHTYQKKLSTEPPGPCKNDQKHGPQENGRKDGLCRNCGVFADKAAKKPSRAGAA